MAPGLGLETNRGEYGRLTVDSKDYQVPFDRFDEFRARRYHRDENKWRRRHGQEVVSKRVPKMLADDKLLVGDEAITAIAAAFEIAPEWKSERWKREAQQEATNEQLHTVESGHPAGT